MSAKRFVCVALILLVAGPALAGEAKIVRRPVDYGQVIRATANMVRDRQAQALARKHGLSLVDLTWEDTGRFKNSALGPNISDMTIQVQHMDRRRRRWYLTCMPVIRYANFSDKTADIRLEKFFLLVGNEAGRSRRRISLKEYLGNFRKYLSNPNSWRGRQSSLLAARDTHALVSAQACFLPVPRRRAAEFNPVVFNYQSYRGNPAVLAILATREGTSATVIDNVRDGFHAGRARGQRLFFNQSGRRASLTGRRTSDVQPIPRRDGDGAAVVRGPGCNMVMLIQVPLQQVRPRRRVYAAEGATDADAKAAAGMKMRRGSDVETAVIGHGRVGGPFTEIDNLAIRRDPKYPIRITVQFYKATSNGVVDERDIAAIRAQIDRTYRDGDYVGSLVVEGETGRPTEHDGPKHPRWPEPTYEPQPAPKYQPPAWWDTFWQKYEKETGETRQAAIGRLYKKIGRERLLLIIDDEILLGKKLNELNK